MAMAKTVQRFLPEAHTQTHGTMAHHLLGFIKSGARDAASGEFEEGQRGGDFPRRLVQPEVLHRGAGDGGEGVPRLDAVVTTRTTIKT